MYAPRASQIRRCARALHAPGALLTGLLILSVAPLATGCRWTGVDTDSGCPPDTGTLQEPVIPQVIWGDLHNHTNLSHDGCEDPDNGCLPDGTLPGEGAFPRALASGLGFAALTDHAEFVAYERPSTGAAVNVWEHTADLVREADGTGVVGVMGYEWTSSCTGQDETYSPMHRTVLIEDVDACPGWRIPSCHSSGRVQYGAEIYSYSALAPAIRPSDLLERLESVGTSEGCEASRSIAFFHHTAQVRPAAVDWADPESFVDGDALVEIASEHGSSECDLSVAPAAACAFRQSTDYHTSTGSVQYALQMGHKLGFVGGTDNHQDEPGKVGDGPGHVRDLVEPTREDPWHLQYTEGTLTGALVTEDGFDRAMLFDILSARHTVVATWAAVDLIVYADGADGVRYLPGDNIPLAAMPLALTVLLGDPQVTRWEAEVVDAFGASTADMSLTIPVGEARYVRVQAWIGEDEHRIWASPFFAE